MQERHSRDGYFIVGEGLVGSNRRTGQYGWLATWGPVERKNGGHGSLGTAVLMPSATFTDVAETGDHYLAVSTARSGVPADLDDARIGERLADEHGVHSVGIGLADGQPGASVGAVRVGPQLGEPGLRPGDRVEQRPVDPSRGVQQLAREHPADAPRAIAADGQQVALINEAMAKKYWAGREAIGGRFRQGGPDRPMVTVVGIVGSTRFGSSPIDGAMSPYVWFAISAPMAPTTAEARSLRVEVMTRAANVDALSPCSAPTMKYASRARAVAAASGPSS